MTKMNRMRGSGGWVLILTMVIVLSWGIVGCDLARMVTVQVRNLSASTLKDVRLTGVEPEIAFGLCRQNADASVSYEVPLNIHPDVAIEYSIDGKAYRQPLNADGKFPAKLRNRDVIVELQFTTNRVWTWTMKKGHVVK